MPTISATRFVCDFCNAEQTIDHEFMIDPCPPRWPTNWWEVSQGGEVGKKVACESCGPRRRWAHKAA